MTKPFRDIPDPDVYFAKAEKDFSLTASEDLTDGVSFAERMEDNGGNL